ncbi:MAG TPA: IclR family transcriptional regulator [Caulobacteraceae bacterium]|nr:IclR family transcriptional regulator [Caulobacteraceae bacterium]
MFAEPYEHLGAKRRGINSVEQGVAVLQAVVDLKKAASLKEIAEQAGMESSQTHRYVSSLVNCGMLRQDAATGRYDLGPTALRTGIAALSRHDALTRAEETARDFSNSSGATTLVSVWASGGPTVIRWNPGSPPVYTMLTIGSVLPVATSSTGKVFLAFLPEAQLAPVLLAEGHKLPLAKDPSLLKERERMRTTFLCDIDSPLVRGLRVFAAPILGVNDALVAVVTAFVPESVPRKLDEGYRRGLLAACAKATSDLGGNWLGPRP